ncbi:CheR family methyltransferase [Alkalicoccus daliensis]|uniref:protein-glutamate O-methyltransferase n=1 Tax=Alkalicoccus daliensis TaxID=745820 RepID=A0A1H0AVL1_9BACI|nr:protein-glutamate O-methyltransferase CheR [Alkalicoccus daliensis]SDN37371.1 chemotaxis protein methyltransferase CheR [Alkalicoccus daliensis]
MEDYQQFTAKIHTRTGINLALYKEAQMKRRLTSLREKRGYSNFDAYYSALTKDQELFEEFLQRMTINVSEFFRNRSRWDVLEKKIMPRILKDKTKIKIWSAACSTGEEPYSLSILMKNLVEPSQFSITATDLDNSILERAKKGFYPERSLKEVTTDHINKYFTAESLGYVVKDELKKQITFKKHNLLDDSYGSGYDLIVCRNVMIYFTEEAKNIMYQKFSDALNKGGVLFVGSTEQIFNPGKYGLETEDTFFYKKK